MTTAAGTLPSTNAKYKYEIHLTAVCKEYSTQQIALDWKKTGMRKNARLPACHPRGLEVEQPTPSMSVVGLFLCSVYGDTCFRRWGTFSAGCASTSVYPFEVWDKYFCRWRTKSTSRSAKAKRQALGCPLVIAQTPICATKVNQEGELHLFGSGRTGPLLPISGTQLGAL